MFLRLVKLLPLIVFTGCNPNQFGILGLTSSAIDLKKAESIGRICGGERVSFEFRIPVDADSASVVELGKFQSSCSCLNSDPKIEMSSGKGTLSVPVTWDLPMPRLSQNMVSENHVVETVGTFSIRGKSTRVALRLLAEVCSPISISSNPLRIKQTSHSTLGLVVKREGLSKDAFSKISFTLPHGFEMTELYRGDETIRANISTNGVPTGHCLMQVAGLPASLSVPIVVEPNSTIQLSRNIVFAKLVKDKWIAVFQFSDRSSVLIKSSLVSGGDLDNKILDGNSFEVHIAESCFLSDWCEVDLEFRNAMGGIEKLRAKVWKDHQ